jgi:broad specificity phosphatase PhoE
LSDLGIEQCSQLRQHFIEQQPLAKDIGLIVVSPLRRTLQTALLVFDWITDKGVKIVPDAIWQGEFASFLLRHLLIELPETSDKPCDTGSKLTQVKEWFSSVDLSEVDPLFPSKDGRYAFTEKAVLERGKDALTALATRPEKVIAVVSHAGFLRTAISQRHFMNADYRIFDFIPLPNGKVELKERAETDLKGGGMGASWKGIAPLEDNDFPA